MTPRSYSSDSPTFEALEPRLLLSAETFWAVNQIDTDGDVGRYAAVVIDSEGRQHMSYYDADNGALKYAVGGWDDVTKAWVGTTETVDDLGDVGQFTSIAVNLDDLPRISYFDVTNADLKFAAQDALGVWHIETIAHAGDIGQFTSLDLNKTGRPRISYYDGNNTSLKYAAWYEANRRGTVVVDQTQGIAGTPDAWQDTNGIWWYKLGDFTVNNSMLTVQLADVGDGAVVADGIRVTDGFETWYVDNGDVMYSETGTGWADGTGGHEGDYRTHASNSGSNVAQWRFENLAPGTFEVFATWVDDAGNSPNAAYAILDGPWRVETVDNIGSVGTYNSLELNSIGYPRISYYNLSAGTLMYAEWNGFVWMKTAVAGGEAVSASWTYDGYGGLDPGMYELWVTWVADPNNTTGAPFTILDGGTIEAIVLIDQTMAVDAEGTFSDDAGHFFRLLGRYPIGSGEVTVRLDTSANGAVVADAVWIVPLEFIGGAWVPDYFSFRNEVIDNFDLGYVETGTGWQSNVPENVAGYGANHRFHGAAEVGVRDAGAFSSLALDISGRPHISYYDSINNNLEYAVWHSGSWLTDVIDEVGDVGAFSSLWLDSAGKPHISYLDYTNGDLKYAKWTGNVIPWAVETVDTVGWNPFTQPGLGNVVGLSTCLTLDISGKPQIAYFNYTNNNLNLIYQDLIPTLSSFTTLTGATESVPGDVHPFSFTYAQLLAASNAGDPDGDALSFRLEEVIAGNLQYDHDGNPATPMVDVPLHTHLGTDPGDTWVWTAPYYATGVQDAFSVTAWDYAIGSYDPGDNDHENDPDPITVTIDVDPLNSPPTLTTVTVLPGAIANRPFDITYDMLANAANEWDPEGDPISFVVEKVISGTLVKGGFPAVEGLTTLAAGETLVWTSAAGAFGAAVQAFNVRAYDGTSKSDSDVTVSIQVGASGNAPPTLTTIAMLTGATEDEDFTITYAALAAAANEADADGNPISFRVEAITAGTLREGGMPVVVGVSLLSSGESWIWHPAADTNGTLNMFTVVAWDGLAASATPVQVTTEQALAVNDAPTAEDQTVDVGVDTPTAITLVGDDVETAAVDLVFEILTQPFNGTVDLVDNVATYTPDAGYTGPDAFAFTVTDNGDPAGTHWNPGDLTSAAAIVTINVTQNLPPTLTTVNTLIGATENQPFTITYETLAAAANEADPEGEPVSFLIDSVSAGTLTKGGVAVVPGTTLLSAGESLVWTPPAATSGVIEAFKVKASDGALLSGTAVPVSVNVVQAPGPIGAQILEAGLTARIVPGNRKNGVLKKVVVLVSNTGGTEFFKVAAIDLYAAPTQTLDPATAVKLGTVQKLLRIKPGKTAKVTFKKVSMNGVSPGNYYLIVDSDEFAPSATSTTVEVAVPGIDLTGTAAAVKYSVGETTEFEKLYVTMLNQGNADVSAEVVINLYASADATLDDADTLLRSSVQKLKLKAGKTKKIGLGFARMDYGLGDVFNLIVDIDATNVVAEINELNNEVLTSATIKAEAE
ncbi:MAG: Ig-like domain-containing protein [Planctomycetota bacterium]